MDTQVGPSGSKGSITVFPEMQPRHSEPGILRPQLLPLLLKKKVEGTFSWIYFSKVLLTEFSLGQYSRCKISARCEVFCFQREKNQTYFWSQMGCSCSPPLSFWSNTRRRGNISSPHFYFTKWLPQRKPLRTMKNNHTEICASKPFLWALPWDAEVEAAGQFWMLELANPSPFVFPWMQIDTDHLEAYPKFKSLNKLFSNSKED